jgi:poly(glycerol-phosphate) alpha-glucosyltransferase
MPAGRYLSITIDVHQDYGGQTRAMLMRNRILAAHGADADVLTVGAAPDLDRRREILRERKLLSDDLDLLNIYEHYRDTDWPDDDPTDEQVADLSSHLVKEQTRLDGSPWRRTYRFSDQRPVHDYLRPDGSTYLRVPSFIFKDPTTWPTDITRISRDGRVTGRFKSTASWYRTWLRDLSGGEQSFVFMDSRYMVPHIAPMRSRKIHLIYLMHNIHVGGERRWDSPTGEVYERVIDLIGSLDAFVTLTARQGEDIAQRRGRTSNMFVVPNPVDLPPEPPVVERDPRLVTVVARIEGQKRLSHAVRAFKHVRAEVPDARMEIYGRGSRSDGIQKVIDRLDLGDSVTMKGHDPHAREALWKSSAFLMTSMFEGYPLSTLESMSHGCPVVSYDIKYGPREQITDGKDGFLVEAQDIQGMAARVVELLKDPDLVAQMSKAAREKAAAHGYDQFLADWRAVLEQAVLDKPKRVRITDAALTVHRLSVGRGPAAPGRFARARKMRLDATLRVEARGDLSRAQVTLAAVHEGSGLVVDLPLKVKHVGDELRLTASAPLSALYPQGAREHDRCKLRVRLTWANAAWETWVTRPDDAPSGLEVTFGPTDEWILSRT